MQFLKKLGWKGSVIVLVLIVASVTVALALWSSNSAERRQNELSKATNQVAKNVEHMDKLVADWRDVWQSVALGTTSFDAGVKRLEDISVASLEVGETLNKVQTPAWLEPAPKHDFDNMKKDLRNACSALSVAAKAGSRMLKSGLLTSKDLAVMAGYSKDANEHLYKSMNLLNRFKEGYGLEKDKKALPAK